MKLRPRWPAFAALGLQAVFAVVLIVCAVSPRTAEMIGRSNDFKRLKGWDATTQATIRRAQVEMADRGLTAIAVDDRFLFNSMAYYGRDFFARPGAPPLKIWLSGAQAGNQAEAAAPLTRAFGERVLVVTAAEVRTTEDAEARMSRRVDLISKDFDRARTLEVSRARLDRKRIRRGVLILGEGFDPAPRQ